jgi:hypothetical protein
MWIGLNWLRITPSGDLLWPRQRRCRFLIWQGYSWRVQRLLAFQVGPAVDSEGSSPCPVVLSTHPFSLFVQSSGLPALTRSHCLSNPPAFQVISFLKDFWPQFCVHSHFCLSWYLSQWRRPAWFHNPNDVRWRVKTAALLTAQLFSVPRPFTPLKSNYFIANLFSKTLNLLFSSRCQPSDILRRVV